MRNVITTPEASQQTLATTNDGSNVLIAQGTSYDTSWLNQDQYDITLTNYTYVRILNSFVGESGNFFLVFDHTEQLSSNYVRYYYNVAKYGDKYIFGDKNEKFKFENALAKSQTVNTLKTNFQAGVDAIYNAETAQSVPGVPTASTPTALADGVGAIATAKYNNGKSDGVTEGKAAVQTDTLYIEGMAYVLGNSITLEISVKNQSLGGRVIYSASVTDSSGRLQVDLDQTKSAKHSFSGRISQIV